MSENLKDIAESVQTAHSDSDSDIDGNSVTNDITERVTNLTPMNGLPVIQNYIGQSRTTCSHSLFTSRQYLRFHNRSTIY